MSNFIEVESTSHGNVVISKQHVVIFMDGGNGLTKIYLSNTEKPIIVKHSLQDVKIILEQ